MMYQTLYVGPSSSVGSDPFKVPMSGFEAYGVRRYFLTFHLLLKVYLTALPASKEWSCD